jgi:xanthine dehydrogenase accessory factor
MDSTIHKLLPLYRRARADGASLVLATIVATHGSTYRKAGAQMLLSADHGSAGMLSGGCVEADLAARAERVLATGQPMRFEYDGRQDSDAIWGLDSGCPGAMEIWLCRVGPETGWEPFACVDRAMAANRHVAYGLVLESGAGGLPAGAVVAPLLPEECERTRDTSMFVAAVAPPPRLLVCGAGDDAIPLATYAATLDWPVTVVDRRPAFLDTARFPSSTRLVCCMPESLSEAVALDEFGAAVVMNHRLAADHAILRQLADSAVPFVGLLGPPSRRDALLARLGATAQRLEGRLHAPVGLNLGGRDEAAVALSIAAQLLAFFARDVVARHP